jgi:hypothetical protein
VNAAPATQTARLGLRYVIRQAGDGEIRDVNPDKTFFSGDRIRIAVQSNEAAYLYVVQEGSNGSWGPLYPEVAGQHKLTPMSMVDIPPGTNFIFDNTPGTERLLVVLSRTPERDLDKLVDSLRNGRAQSMTAALSNPVEKFRASIQSRNLRIEKRPEVLARREEAVYVINEASGEAGGRVVAEILLKHR